MITKNLIKQINSLQYKKYRKISKLFIAEGNKTVNDLLRISSIMNGQQDKTQQTLRQTSIQMLDPHTDFMKSLFFL